MKETQKKSNNSSYNHSHGSTRRGLGQETRKEKTKKERKKSAMSKKFVKDYWFIFKVQPNNLKFNENIKWTPTRLAPGALSLTWVKNNF